MKTSLKDLKNKNIETHDFSYADYGVDEEVGKLIDFLHEDEMTSTGFVTKKRIIKNLDG
jgi:hypothetical protein